ncbi:hypothetical protein E4U55_007971 [Claviceps digitariae]|nr:hypothetical protein E4U55_007971 [Claviceps digitariae]
MAHLIARKPREYPFHITGLLLIDSPYHTARSTITEPLAHPDLPDLPDLVRAAFASCDQMLQHWELPRWSGSSKKRPAQFTIAGGWEFKLQPSDVLYKPATVGAKAWTTFQTKTAVEAAGTEAAGTETAGTEAPTAAVTTTKISSTKAPTATEPTTKASTTKASTTKAPTTKASTAKAPTTKEPSTKASTTETSTTKTSTAKASTTKTSTTKASTTKTSTTKAPTTKTSTTKKAAAEPPTQPAQSSSLPAPPAPAAPGTPPPAVLLRCTKLSKPSPDSAPDLPCLVDLYRSEKLLGWEGQYPDFIKAVIDVDADHYNIFDRGDMKKMADVTARVGWALDVLDGLYVISKARGTA